VPAAPGAIDAVLDAPAPPAQAVSSHVAARHAVMRPVNIEGMAILFSRLRPSPRQSMFKAELGS